MSRGLGKLQQRILAIMQYRRTGQDRIQIHGIGMLLGNGWGHDDLYDLRYVQQQMSHAYEKRDRLVWMDATFQAAFSRAVRSLVNRGVLEDVCYRGGGYWFTRGWESREWNSSEKRAELSIRSRAKTRLVRIKSLPALPQWALDEARELLDAAGKRSEQRSRAWLAANGMDELRLISDR